MVFCRILQYFVAKSVVLRFTLFCREISFGTIYALLRGEKFSEQFCPWRKNDKYEVWGEGLGEKSTNSWTLYIRGITGILARKDSQFNFQHFPNIKVNVIKIVVFRPAQAGFTMLPPPRVVGSRIACHFLLEARLRNLRK